MTSKTNTSADGSLCLAFPGRGRNLHVWLAPGVNTDELMGMLAVFMPYWSPRRVFDQAIPDVTVTRQDGVYCVRAASWEGGESLAHEPNNAANAIAGMLVDGLLAHGMATHCLHTAAAEIDGRAILFCGPAEAGKSTLALRLAIRGYRHLADDRMLLSSENAPHQVVTLGLAAKAREPLPPGRGLADLVATRWEHSDEGVTYLHLLGEETAIFGRELPLGAIIVPRRDPDWPTDAELMRAAPGEIARTLIEEATSPAGPTVIVPAMTRLADDVDGFILSYRDGDAAADVLVEAFKG